jgi:hypothetical protein
MNARTGIGLAVVVVVVVGVLFAPIGGGSFFDFAAERTRLSNPDVSIETILSSDGASGTFTASGVPICDVGVVTRGDSATSATGSWYEDEYQCSSGAGAFILRGELPPNPDASGDLESFHGTWEVTSGRDDYGRLQGGGTSKVTLGPPRIESYTGTLTHDR